MNEKLQRSIKSLENVYECRMRFQKNTFKSSIDSTLKFAQEILNTKEESETVKNTETTKNTKKRKATNSKVLKPIKSRKRKK